MKYQFGNCLLDTDRVELTRDGKPIAVEPQVFRVVVYLIENRDRVVSKDELVENVWRRQFVSDGALTTCLNAARTAIGDNGRDQALIRTYPRTGVRFVAGVREAGPASTPHAGSVPDRPSIAVMAFDNMSNDPEQDYFSEGMAEDLITDISKISGIFVVARNSSFAFRGKAAEVSEIGEKLGVGYILEGSVRKLGSRLRVNAQLIDARTGGHVWSERYDGSLDEIFRFQDDIRAQIIAALEVYLTPADRESSANWPTQNVEAYDLFLRGRSAFHRFTDAHFHEAKTSFETAIEFDPEFADAHAYLSYCLYYSWFQMQPGSEDDLQRAWRVAEKAVVLDGNSAVAIAHLGWVQTFRREYDEAVRNYEAAIRLSPDSAEVHADFGQVLNYCGDPQRALTMIDRAFTLDTVAPPLWEFYAGHAHLLLGHHDKAESLLKRSIEQIPRFTAAYLRLAVTFVETDCVGEARDLLRTVLDVVPAYTLRELDRILPYRRKEDRERILGNLQKAGFPTD